MILNKQYLYSKHQTGKELKRLAKSYRFDLFLYKVKFNGRLISLALLSLKDFFDSIKRIPYRKDRRPIEQVKRPLFTLLDNLADCKKKSIIIAAYCEIKNIKYRFMTTSNLPNKKIHHVYVQVFNPKLNKWLNVDSTYNNNKLFSKKNVTNWEVL